MNEFLVYEKTEIPKELFTGDTSRTGDFLVLCNSGNLFLPFKKEKREILRGMHGYPPSNLDMCGIFLAFGHNVPQKKIDTASIVDICPTILKSLRIDSNENLDGKPLF
ncbi:MAG: hypothetical protein N2445_02880 [Acidobacteria bacterium]|nr:hypothetical protein [Acidobacteriota bacterium]